MTERIRAGDRYSRIERIHGRIMSETIVRGSSRLRDRDRVDENLVCHGSGTASRMGR